MGSFMCIFDSSEFRLFQVSSKALDETELRRMLEDEPVLGHACGRDPMYSITVYVRMPQEVPVFSGEGSGGIEFVKTGYYVWMPAEAVLIRASEAPAKAILEEIASEHDGLSVEEIPYKIFGPLRYERRHMLAAEEVLKKNNLPCDFLGIICQAASGRLMPELTDDTGRPCILLRRENGKNVLQPVKTDQMRKSRA